MLTFNRMLILKLTLTSIAILIRSQNSTAELFSLLALLAPGRFGDAEELERKFGDGSDATPCGHEKGSGYPYPGCQNCDGGRVGNNNQQGGGYTCECVGENAKVRTGASGPLS